MTNDRSRCTAHRAARAGGCGARFRARGGRALRAAAAPVIRVLLDREGGIDLDAIGSASEWVSELLDERTRSARRTCSRSPRRASTARSSSAATSSGSLARRSTLKVAAARQAQRPGTGVLVGIEGDDVVARGRR